MSFGLILIGRVASGVDGVAGAWLMASPVASGRIPQHSADLWEHWWSGGLKTFGMLRLLSPRELPVVSWIDLALGTFVLLSPWLFHHRQFDTWSR